jgi:hypothetical protein
MRGALISLFKLAAAILVALAGWVHAASDYDQLIELRSGKFDNIAENLRSPHSSKYGETVQTLATARDVEMLESISKNAPNAELRIMALQKLRGLVARRDFVILLQSVMHDSVNKGRYDGETLGSSQKIFNFGLNTLNELLGSNYQEVRLLSRPEDLARAKEIVRSFAEEGGANATNNNGDIQILHEEQEGEPQGPELPTQDISDSITLGDPDDQGNAKSGAIWPYVLVAVALVGIVIVLVRSRKCTPDC